MTVAFVFPGQGSQSVGMLGSLAGEQAIRSTFDEASSALGYDLWQLCQSGPESDLNSTERTQPAMLAAGVAVWRLWQARGGAKPDIVSGHSLGEFTALVCSEALDFKTAISLVAFRGKAMQEAVPPGAGAMAAILGLEDIDAEKACAEAAQGSVVEAANYNAPGQVVIAGEAAAVQRAIEACKARGAKRAIALPVSVPSHSSLMRSAGERLGERLNSIEVRTPRIRYISAVDATAHTDPADIRTLLVRQLSSPVRWATTVQNIVAAGATRVIECGPGKVLTGLNRRIERNKDIAMQAVEDEATLTIALNGAPNA